MLINETGKRMIGLEMEYALHKCDENPLHLGPLK